MKTYLKSFSRVWFIPYTTGVPQIKMGLIERDDKGEFIAYGNKCDDGEGYICPISEIPIYTVNAINFALRKVVQNK